MSWSRSSLLCLHAFFSLFYRCHHICWLALTCTCPHPYASYNHTSGVLSCTLHTFLYMHTNTTHRVEHASFIPLYSFLLYSWPAFHYHVASMFMLFAVHSQKAHHLLCTVVIAPNFLHPVLILTFVFSKYNPNNSAACLERIGVGDKTGRSCRKQKFWHRITKSSLRMASSSAEQFLYFQHKITKHLLWK